MQDVIQDLRSREDISTTEKTQAQLCLSAQAVASFQPDDSGRHNNVQKQFELALANNNRSFLEAGSDTTLITRIYHNGIVTAPASTVVAGKGAVVEARGAEVTALDGSYIKAYSYLAPDMSPRPESGISDLVEAIRAAERAAEQSAHPTSDKFDTRIHAYNGCTVTLNYGFDLKNSQEWFSALAQSQSEGLRSPAVAEAHLEHRIRTPFCEALSGSTVYAYQNSNVAASAGATVFACPGSTTWAGDGASINANSGATIHDNGGVIVVGKTDYDYKNNSLIHVAAYGGAHVRAGQNAVVDAYPGSEIWGSSGATIRMHSACLVHANGATVVTDDGSEVRPRE